VICFDDILVPSIEPPSVTLSPPPPESKPRVAVARSKR
jgi:hypothetical protein